MYQRIIKSLLWGAVQAIIHSGTLTHIHSPFTYIHFYSHTLTFSFHIHTYFSHTHIYSPFTYIHTSLTHTYILLSHTYILLSHTYILLSHTYIFLSHTYILLSHTYIFLSHTYILLSHTYIFFRHIHSIYMYVKGEYMCVWEKNVCMCKENVCMWEREYSGNGRQIASTIGPILADMRCCRTRLSLGIGEKIMGQSRADYKTLLADRRLFSMGQSRLKAVARAAGLVCSCVYLSSARVSFVTGGPLLEWRRSAAWEKDSEVNFKSWGAFGGTVLKRNTSAAKSKLFNLFNAQCSVVWCFKSHEVYSF